MINILKTNRHRDDKNLREIFAGDAEA